MTRRAIVAIVVWAAIMVIGIAIAAGRQHDPPIGTTPPATAVIERPGWYAPILARDAS